MTREGAFVESEIIGDKGMVSIIVRTMEGRFGMLCQCIASILNQSYQNIEIVVVQDRGFTMQEFFQNLQNTYPNLKIKYVKSNGAGRVAAGNTGLNCSSGDFLMFLDDDDYLFGDHIEMNVQAIDDADFAYTYAWDLKTDIIDMQKAEYREEGFEFSQYFTRDHSVERLKYENFIPIQSALFRRSLYEQHGGFDTRLDMLEDGNLWLRFSQTGTFKVVPKITSAYRTPANEKKHQERRRLFDASYSEVFEVNKKYWLSRTQ